METWDLFDSNRQPLLRTRKRGLDKTPGEYHIVVEVWTVNSAKNILVTLRDSNKKLYPNKWENTGGSALAGETSRQGAVRELVEETGIVAQPEELTLLGTQQGDSAFYDIYILHRDIAIEQLTMQPGETTAAKWITLQQLETMIADQTLAYPIGVRFNHVKTAFLNFLDTL